MDRVSHLHDRLQCVNSKLFIGHVLAVVSLVTVIVIVCFYPKVSLNNNTLTINNDTIGNITTTTNDGGENDDNNNNTTTITSVDNATTSNIITAYKNNIAKSTTSDNDNISTTTLATNITTMVNDANTTPIINIKEQCVYENTLKTYPQEIIIEYKSNVQESYQKYINQLNRFRKCLDLFKNKLLSMSCNEHLHLNYATPSNYNYCSTTKFWGYSESTPCVIFTYGENMAVIPFNHMRNKKDSNIECGLTTKNISNETNIFRIIIH